MLLGSIVRSFAPNTLDETLGALIGSAGLVGIVLITALGIFFAVADFTPVPIDAVVWVR